MEDKLFVYGTLLSDSDHPMAQYLEKSAVKLCRGQTRGVIYDLGEYPGLKEDFNDENQVKGEIYRLLEPWNSLPVIDQYEDYFPDNPAQSMFIRKRTPVLLESKEKIMCWVYYYILPVTHTQRIDSGDYISYLQLKG